MLLAGINKEILRSHNVLVQTVRYGKRVNLRRPRPPHFKAQAVDKTVSVQIPKPYDVDFPSFLKCREPLMKMIKVEVEENPYERILANELIASMNNSKMILFFHKNPMPGEEYYKSIKTFKKAGMELSNFGKSTVEMAVKDTKFASIMCLFHSHTLILCSPELKLDLVFKLIKKMPKHILLAGIVEDRFLHRNKLEEYSKLANLDVARSQFVGVLNKLGSQLTNDLLHPQMTLVNNLDNYVKNEPSS